MGGTFDKSNILTINRCIHKGNKLREGHRRPGCVPGRGNNRGEDFPRLGILPEVIDGKGRLGGQESHVIGKKRRIPTDGHPPRKDLMGGAPWGSPGVPRDGKKMKFPTIAAPRHQNKSGMPTDQAERMIGGN